MAELFIVPSVTQNSFFSVCFIIFWEMNIVYIKMLKLILSVIIKSLFILWIYPSQDNKIILPEFCCK